MTNHNGTLITENEIRQRTFRSAPRDATRKGTRGHNSRVIYSLCVLLCAKGPVQLKKSRGKTVSLHAMEALGGRGIAPTHSRPRH
jgi:hypothetical protein